MQIGHWKSLSTTADKHLIFKLHISDMNNSKMLLSSYSSSSRVKKPITERKGTNYRVKLFPTRLAVRSKNRQHYNIWLFSGHKKLIPHWLINKTQVKNIKYLLRLFEINKGLSQICSSSCTKIHLYIHITHIWPDRLIRSCKLRQETKKKKNRGTNKMETHKKKGLVGNKNFNTLWNRSR